MNYILFAAQQYGDVKGERMIGSGYVKKLEPRSDSIERLEVVTNDEIIIKFNDDADPFTVAKIVNQLVGHFGLSMIHNENRVLSFCDR